MLITNQTKNIQQDATLGNVPSAGIDFVFELQNEGHINKAFLLEY